MKMVDEKNNVNLFDMDADDSSMSFLDKKGRNKDGLYRPTPKEAKNKQRGYVATVRFLPNVLEDGTLGPSAIENQIHYANLPDYPDLIGYYDSLINFGEKCPLTTLYWKLRNSKNQAEVERAKLIQRNPKYYSYVLIIEDEQHPEFEGKIMIWPYSKTIKEKINLERTGEITGKKCNVFDPANGKDFRVICKDGTTVDYDTSSFLETSPLKMYDEDKKRFIAIPVEYNEEKQKNVVSNPKVQKKLMDYLTGHGLNLLDHAPKRWTEEQQAKVDKIIEILSGGDFTAAKSKIEKGSNSSKSTDSLKEADLDDEVDSDDLDNFFDKMDDDK